MMADDGSSGVAARYRDAYSVAESTVHWGNALKILGIVGAVVIGLIGVVAAEYVGVGAVIASLVAAVGIGGMLYALGVTVAAQGQIIRAVLDTAVNTSPLLSVEQKREVIAPSISQASLATSGDISQWG
jgi:hypothetical protein